MPVTASKVCVHVICGSWLINQDAAWSSNLLQQPQPFLHTCDLFAGAMHAQLRSFCSTSQCPRGWSACGHLD
jgi:hypothetical protein